MSKKPNSADLPLGRIVVFQEKSVRRTWHQNAWWFSVRDIVAVLTDSPSPTDYIKKIRLRDKELAHGWGQLITPLKVETESGVQRVNCANAPLEVERALGPKR